VSGGTDTQRLATDRWPLRPEDTMYSFRSVLGNGERSSPAKQNKIRTATAKELQKRAAQQIPMAAQKGAHPQGMPSGSRLPASASASASLLMLRFHVKRVAQRENPTPNAQRPKPVRCCRCECTMHSNFYFYEVRISKIDPAVTRAPPTGHRASKSKI
jgi:hypothetical protein